MNRAPIILGIALIIAAIAPGRAQTTATAAPTEQNAVVQQIPLDAAQQSTTSLKTADGLMEGFTYSLTFSQPDGLTGELTSVQSYPNQWGGAEVDRLSTAQAIEMTGKWDSVPQATNLTLETPGKDIERVEVEFDPNTAYDPKTSLPMTDLSNYSVQSVSMIPSEDGEVTACSFPVSFLSPDGEQDYDQVFCIIHITFRDGDSCDIGCALTRKA